MSQKILISFATPQYEHSQSLLEECAYKNGVDKVFSYKPGDLDSQFVKNNFKILSSPRGAGYWLWKPYLIHKTLVQAEEDDLVLYCDSGMYPIEHLRPLYDICDEKEILLFQVHKQPNKMWTKGDCFKAMECEDEFFYEAEQVCGAPQVYKKGPEAFKFLEEYLTLCTQPFLITDSPSIMRKSFPEFKDHRHDQSILSLLALKRGIEIFRDPSQYGEEHKSQYANSPYPTLFNLHRSHT